MVRRTVHHLGADSPQDISFYSEVIAAPQEQPEQAQEERRVNPAQGPSDLSSE